MTSQIPPDIDEASKARLSEEEDTLGKTLVSLKSSYQEEEGKLFQHSRDARDLTSQLVGAQRDSDKQLLANDENIAHQLSQRARESTTTIEALIENPYFGRIVIEEEIGNKLKTAEYKIGKATNLEASILDWKTSPLARLFYEYEEGEEFLEEIRDRERSGFIRKRSKVKIVDSELLQVSCPLGTFEKQNGQWILSSRIKASKNGQFNLPDILSLITAEQFRLITEDSDQPVILHGVAGSGKTSVALHRLAWQLENQHGTSPLVLTPTALLCKYVQNSLQSLEVKTEIPVVTIKKWIDDLAISEGVWENYKKLGSLPPPPIARLKSSLSFLKALLKVSAQGGHTLTETIAKALYEESFILENDKTRIISKETIREARALFLKNQNDKILDEIDTELILLLKSLKARAQGKYLYSHVFLDEFQDISAIELALIALSIKDLSTLTITGDAEQHTTESVTYSDALESIFIALGKEFRESAIYPLSISHRSTLQIMKFADSILGKTRTIEGRAGKPPLLIQCLSKSHALSELISWIQRVHDKFSGETILILAKSNEEAKHLTSLLTPHLSDGVSTLTDAPRNSEGMVLIAGIQDCKGLEFPHVMIWDVSTDSFPPKKLGQTSPLSCRNTRRRTFSINFLGTTILPTSWLSHKAISAI